MISSAAVNLEYQPDPRSLAEKAYQILVRKIIQLELMPGEPLADKVLIEKLGIGRTPIREALQRLPNGASNATDLLWSGCAIASPRVNVRNTTSRSAKHCQRAAT